MRKQLTSGFFTPVKEQLPVFKTVDTALSSFSRIVFRVNNFTLAKTHITINVLISKYIIELQFHKIASACFLISKLVIRSRKNQTLASHLQSKFGFKLSQINGNCKRTYSYPRLFLPADMPFTIQTHYPVALTGCNFGIVSVFSFYTGIRPCDSNNTLVALENK